MNFVHKTCFFLGTVSILAHTIRSVVMPSVLNSQRYYLFGGRASPHQPSNSLLSLQFQNGKPQTEGSVSGSTRASSNPPNSVVTSLPHHSSAPCGRWRHAAACFSSKGKI